MDHEIKQVEVEAYLYSKQEPTPQQQERLKQFLADKYQKEVGITWKKDDTVADGFRMEVGTSVYKWDLAEIFDWTPEGRSRQLKQAIRAAISKNANVMPMIREAVQNFTPSPEGEQVGTVLTVGDGIATVSGLPNAEYGEILVFENGLKGMILDLKEEEIGCVIFGDDADIMQGSTVRRTGKVACRWAGPFWGVWSTLWAKPWTAAPPLRVRTTIPLKHRLPALLTASP